MLAPTGAKVSTPSLSATDTSDDIARLMVPSGPLTEMAPPKVTATPVGHEIGLLATRDKSAPSYATTHRTSPPTPLARAWRSVITPLEVETIATPKPFMTRGRSSAPL